MRTSDGFGRPVRPRTEDVLESTILVNLLTLGRNLRDAGLPLGSGQVMSLHRGGRRRRSAPPPRPLLGGAIDDRHPPRAYPRFRRRVRPVLASATRPGRRAHRCLLDDRRDGHRRPAGCPSTQQETGAGDRIGRAGEGKDDLAIEGTDEGEDVGDERRTWRHRPRMCSSSAPAKHCARRTFPSSRRRRSPRPAGSSIRCRGGSPPARRAGWSRRTWAT